MSIRTHIGGLEWYNEDTCMHEHEKIYTYMQFVHQYEDIYTYIVV